MWWRGHRSSLSIMNCCETHHAASSQTVDILLFHSYIKIIGRAGVSSVLHSGSVHSLTTHCDTIDMFGFVSRFLFNANKLYVHVAARWTKHLHKKCYKCIDLPNLFFIWDANNNMKSINRNAWTRRMPGLDECLALLGTGTLRLYIVIEGPAQNPDYTVQRNIKWLDKQKCVPPHTSALLNGWSYI